MTTENNIKSAFTIKTIKNFDSSMENKIGYTFEGSNDCVWVYRKSKTQFITIQVGFGGVCFVKVYEKNTHDGRLSFIDVDLTGITSPTKLLNKLKKLLVDPK